MFSSDNGPSQHLLYSPPRYAELKSIVPSYPLQAKKLEVVVGHWSRSNRRRTAVFTLFLNCKESRRGRVGGWRAQKSWTSSRPHRKLLLRFGVYKNKMVIDLDGCPQTCSSPKYSIPTFELYNILVRCYSVFPILPSLSGITMLMIDLYGRQ